MCQPPVPKTRTAEYVELRNCTRDKRLVLPCTIAVRVLDRKLLQKLINIAQTRTNLTHFSGRLRVTYVASVCCHDNTFGTKGVYLLFHKTMR